MQGLSLHVNVSPGQLGAPGFPQRVEQMLDEAEVSPLSLTLEVGPEAHQQLDAAVELRDMGVDLVLEDFGTGTTLDDVRRLPVSGVKLHPTFVALAAGAPEEVIIPEALLSIAHVRGLTATGKGIETRDQARRLSSLGATWVRATCTARPSVPRGSALSWPAAASASGASPRAVR